MRDLLVMTSRSSVSILAFAVDLGRFVPITHVNVSGESSYVTSFRKPSTRADLQMLEWALIIFPHRRLPCLLGYVFMWASDRCGLTGKDSDNPILGSDLYVPGART